MTWHAPTPLSGSGGPFRPDTTLSGVKGSLGSVTHRPEPFRRTDQGPEGPEQ